MAVVTDGDENRSALIGILTWFFFLVGVFSLCARFGSKLFLSIKITWDDWLALAAQVSEPPPILLIGFTSLTRCKKGTLLIQASVLSYGIANGLGKAAATLSENRLSRSLEVRLDSLFLAHYLHFWTLLIYHDCAGRIWLPPVIHSSPCADKVVIVCIHQSTYAQQDSPMDELDNGRDSRPLATDCHSGRTFPVRFTNTLELA